MPRNYQRKTDRQNWDPINMKKAIESVNEGRFGYLMASITYNVPKSTLQDRVNKYRNNKDLDASTSKGLGRFKPVFTEMQEQLLVDHVLTMEQRLFGLTFKDLRRLTFQFAESNGIPNNFSKIRKEAGKDWLDGFMKRHPQLSLRAAEPTSVARAMGFNQVSVGLYFDLLEGLIDQYKFPPTKIFNVDETGLTTVPKQQSRVIALKGKKQVGLVSSAERGQLTTAVLCVSASGNYVPPLLIFPRVRMKAELLDGAPPGTIAVCHPSGWIQSDIFVSWLDHFISIVKPNKDEPVLLLLDGHTTHTKNLPLILKARESGVIILSFPPHCTHRLQPLDVSIMGPISTFYTQEVNTWLRNNPGRVVSQFQLSRIFGIAYAKAATIHNAMSGFSKTGIYPTNRNQFSESDFVAAETTELNILQPDINAVPTANILQANPQTEEANTSSTLLSEVNLKPAPKNLSDLYPETVRSSPSTSRVNNASPTPTTSLNLVTSPADIMPIPKISSDRKRSNRRKGKTAIITSSPYKEELTSAISQPKKVKLNMSTKQKCLKKVCDDICVYCLEKYGESRTQEGWVQCTGCKGWAHDGCTGYDSDDLDDFKCTKCLV